MKLIKQNGELIVPPEWKKMCGVQLGLPEGYDECILKMMERKEGEENDTEGSDMQI